MMKRLIPLFLLVAIGLPIAGPAFARRVVVRGGVGRKRTVVVVHRGWPVRRSLRAVYVHPVRVAPRVTVLRYGRPLMFTSALIAVDARPAADRIAWEDAETLSKNEDWTEFTLNCDARGKKLWLDITAGRIQFDWAEIVFESGDARVVDFAEKTHGEGLYSLLDFADGRKVDHVRVVARAKSETARVALRMEKE